MRIISGMARGIRLYAPDGAAVRPTEDRVKESMFSTLGDVQGKVVVDLFSGSGALGLEALSRGAASVHFFEKEAQHVTFIKRNLEAVKKSIGASCGEAKVHCADAKTVLRVIPDVHPDVILADPPYALTAEQYGAAGLVLDDALATWAGDGCLFVLEHADENILPWDEQTKWQLLKTKTYGIRAVSFAVCKIQII